MSVTLKSDIPRILAKMDSETEAVLDEAANEVMEDWRGNVRVDTGELKSSIHVVKSGKGVREVADGVKHGVFNELGSRTISPQPDLTMAMERMRAKYPHLFGKVVKP